MTYDPDANDPRVTDWPATERQLREKIDALRTRVQELRAQLAAAEDPSTLLPRAFNDRQQRWRELRYRLSQRLRSAIGRSQPVHDGAADRSNIRPYRIQIRRPASAVRPRIVHFIGNFLTGGSAQLVVDIVEHLGHAYAHDIIAKTLPAEPAYVGLSIEERKQLRGPESVVSILRTLKPDLVHVHYLFNTRSEQSWRWYHTVFQGIEAYGAKAIENVNILTDPYVSPSVRRYVYVSDYLLRTFGRVDGPNAVIYPGSDLSRFCRTDSEQITDDCIGMVYRLDPGKLNENAIDPFIEAVRRRPATRALIVGDGSYLDRFKAAVRDAGLESAFTFTGYVSYDRLPDLIRRMSVFVAPVEGESFGQVTPFAMGMRLPVAAYDVGALPEILGVQAVLAPPGDAMQLAARIAELLDDRPRRIAIGEYNRQRAERLFSVQTMIERYERLYADVLAF